MKRMEIVSHFVSQEYQVLKKGASFCFECIAHVDGCFFKKNYEKSKPRDMKPQFPLEIDDAKIFESSRRCRLGTVQ